MFVRDPCGIVCIIVTYVAVFYADYVIVQWVVLHTMQDRFVLVPPPPGLTFMQTANIGCPGLA
jgi:hypothetical protein